MKRQVIFTVLLLGLISGLSSSFVQKTPPPAVDIYYHVPFIPQPTGVSCWSTSIAMILWWRDNQRAQACLVDHLTPAQVAGNIGYWRQYFRDGLASSDVNALQLWGFEPVAPQSFPLSELQSMLQTYGPMWVAYYGCDPRSCNHAVVLVGMRGDGTDAGTTVILHDPDAGTGTYPNRGVRDRSMPYTEFIERLNNRAVDRLNQNASDANGVQVRDVHFLAHLR